ncbi:MAG: D-sedoheptulose 7-phosphate isomerase [Cyclobacteriaceae bacterium]
MKDLIKQELNQAHEVLSTFLQDAKTHERISEAATAMANTISNGGKIFSCGNGGSHCDAMHFAEELTGRFRENRKALPAIAISDPSHISCVSNDFGYDQVFSRYIEGLGKRGDVVLGISTSGNSQNVLNAFKTAKDLRIKTIALSGNDGGAIADLSDIEIRVPHRGYADRIQEIHIKVIHILILLIEELTVK